MKVLQKQLETASDRALAHLYSTYCTHYSNIDANALTNEYYIKKRHKKRQYVVYILINHVGRHTFPRTEFFSVIPRQRHVSFP